MFVTSYIKRSMEDVEDDFGEKVNHGKKEKGWRERRYYVILFQNEDHSLFIHVNRKFKQGVNSTQKLVSQNYN